MRKDICFLWPASVLWGRRKTYDGVRLGFSYGNLLPSAAGYLKVAAASRCIGVTCRR